MASFPLFDPGPGPTEVPMLTVTELTAQIKELLELSFPVVAIQGEISNLSRPNSGHYYFVLKDAGASIKAVIWKTQARAIRFDLQNGMAVNAWGEISLYPPHGSYQIVVRKLEPQGIGSLELAFRQLSERLRAEGLFAVERKRPIPTFPKRIVVVTSPTGAAVRDFVQTVSRRWPAAEILVAPAKMQGIGSAEEVALAIGQANRVPDADFVVLVRGGGSIEDLWTFNEELVARAIFKSRLPVVTGIGHENDTTIADYVADLRCLTPTDAAARSVPDRAEVLAQVEHLASRMGRGLGQYTSKARMRLDRLGDRLGASARAAHERAGRRLDPLEIRFQRAVARELDRRREAMATLAGRLEALSPLAVLARGYSLTLAEDGRTVVRDAATLRPGDRIQTRLALGSVTSRVEAVENER